MILHPQHSDRKDLIGVQCSRAISLQQITRVGGTSERGETADTRHLFRTHLFLSPASVLPPPAGLGAARCPAVPPLPAPTTPTFPLPPVGSRHCSVAGGLRLLTYCNFMSFTHSLSWCQPHRHSRQRSHFILLSPAPETNSAT